MNREIKMLRNAILPEKAAKLSWNKVYCIFLILENLQTEHSKVPDELTDMKTKECDLLEKIRNLEERSSKHEIQVQTSCSKNTKLEMKVSALESELHGTAEKLKLVEKESEEYVAKIKELSENLKKATEEKLDLEHTKVKLENESESKFTAKF